MKNFEKLLDSPKKINIFFSKLSKKIFQMK